MTTRPIQWRAIKDALVKWATDTTGLIVAWGNQSAPQPAWPYISMLMLPAPTDLGVHDDEQWTEDGELQIVGQREFGLSIQIHVGPPDNIDPDFDAEYHCHALLASLSLPDVRAELEAAGLGLRGRGAPQPVDALIGGSWISRYLLELRFGVTSVLNPETAPALDGGDYFDKARVSSEITGVANPGGSLELDDELIDPNP
jgi:hypothetical protein